MSLEVASLATIFIGALIGGSICLMVLNELEKPPKHCDICTTEMKTPQCLPCGHKFHEYCIQTWYHTRISLGNKRGILSCPCCRQEWGAKVTIVDCIPDYEEDRWWTKRN